jgi:hypothetical protein
MSSFPLAATETESSQNNSFLSSDRGCSEYSYGGGGVSLSSFNEAAGGGGGGDSSFEEVSDSSQTGGAAFLAAPLARLDSSSESVASVASTVVRAIVPSSNGGGGGGDEMSATASIDSGVVMSSPLVWPQTPAIGCTDKSIGGGISEEASSQREDRLTLALGGEDSCTVEDCAALGGPGGTLAAGSAAKALASLNENLSCLSEVTHIPDANCTVQV